MKKDIIFLFLAIGLIITGCGANTQQNDQIKPLTEVKTQTVSGSRSVKQSVEYPATVSSEQEAKIVAKTAGTAKGVRFNVGDKVSLGQEIFRVDDINSGSNSNSGFNASQIKQASISVQQAAAGYSLAQKNYDNLLLSSQNDLKQAEISQAQSGTGQSNLTITTTEALKSAQLAYDTAVIARQQAKINYDNRVNISSQSQTDVETNSNTAADSAANTCSAIIIAINNITGLDDTVTVAYKNNLGALDNSLISAAKQSYLVAKDQNEKYLAAIFTNVNLKLDAALKLATSVKKLADTTKLLLDRSVTSDVLPQSSAVGVSLSGLQSTVSGYQAQLNGVISQLNAAKQGIANTNLNNGSTLENLKKAYELALKQEAAAKQNLDNLKAGNKSQLDNAGYGVDTAANQLQSTKVRIDSQISVSKSQLDIARLGYSNALASLQGLFDIHKGVSPIDGVVTRKFVDEGDTVSPGQVLATISQSDKVKLELFVNQEDLAFLRLGQNAGIKDNNGKLYDAVVSGITPAADSVTKRFLVEVKPKINNPKIFTIGTIMNVVISYDKKPDNKNNIILPLTAVEIGQNGNNIMIMENGKAKKVSVEVVKVQGETVEIKTNLATTTQIIVEGNKIVEEGEEVKISK